MNAIAPSWGKKTLALVQSAGSQIAAAAARYGVPAEAIAGSLAEEQYDQTASLGNRMKAYLSSLDAEGLLARAYAVALVTHPFDPERGPRTICRRPSSTAWTLPAERART